MQIKIFINKASQIFFTIVMTTSLLLMQVQSALAKPLNAAFTNCASQSEIPETECDALVALYNSTNGAGWNNHTGWLATDTPCSWFGVACTGGYVTSLMLGIQNGSGWQGNQLTGTIPVEIGNLTHLITLVLNDGNLSGPIPVELQNLTALTTLDLSHNALTGSIPASLGSLTNLTTLDLSLNQLSGSIPAQLGNLTNLKKLYIARNQLTGSIPATFSGLTNLVKLFLHNNQLTGSIPTGLAGLIHLESLWLDDNQLTGSIPTQFGVGLINLKELILYNNYLTGSIPTQLGNLTNLTILDIGGNSLSGTIPTEIGNLTNLTHLNVGHNLLGGSIPLSITNLTKLTLLVLSENDLIGSLPANLGNLTELKFLWLHTTSLTGQIPNSFVNLGKLTNFTTNCTLTSTDPKVITLVDSLITPSWDGYCPTNDQLIKPINISALPYTYTQSSFSTTDPNDPTFECGPRNQGKGSLWYKYTPALSGILTVNTIGSNYDTLLAIWTQPFAHLVNVACNDDSAGNGYQSKIITQVTAGKDYYIEVAGYSGGGTLVLNASFAPITKTFTSIATQDGRILESSESSNLGGAINSLAGTIYLGDNAAKKQYRGILSFNTGPGLPDNAIIKRITLKFKKQGMVGGGNPLSIFGGLMVDIKTGFFGTSALQVTDFQATASKIYGPFNPSLLNGWYSINLTVGQTYINKLITKGGLTQIRLRFKLDDNNDAISNYLSLYSSNAAAATDRPQLIVQYYVP